MQLNLTGAAFRSNNSLGQRMPLDKQNPLSTTLDKLIQNVEERSKTNSEQDKKTQKEVISRISFDTYVSSEKAEGAFSEMDTETLEVLKALFGNFDTFATMYQNEIDSFRQNLNGFDQRITQYQEMLDGKSDIPENFSKEQIKQLLDKTKEARESYRKQGAEKVWKKGNYCKAMIEGNSRFSSSILGEDVGNISEMDLEFRANAENIYGEMDRVADCLSTIKDSVGNILQKIQEELEKRGQLLNPINVNCGRDNFDGLNFDMVDKETQSWLSMLKGEGANEK